ncbi:uncharacterized protein LOC134876535 [Eleginops maclovinus]|uniref:uncharacterized protein LOC134876535 n=1 Tax=Eleginops maclovinus TaxID=56733 RepID=UPI003080B992
MSVGLKNAGYTKIPKDLNTGTTGDPIYLWYLQGTTAYDAPIMEIDVTKQAPGEAQKFSQDWERLACDLNRGTGGDRIYAFVKREKQTYICNVTATDSYASDMQLFNDGYIRVDEDANKGSGGAPVFIWYRQTDSPNDAVNYLQISINDSQYTSLLQQNFVQVSVNLNESAGGNQVYLWYKKEGSTNPVKAMTLLLNQEAFGDYEQAGVTVIKRNLNEGTTGGIEYLTVHQ